MPIAERRFGSGGVRVLGGSLYGFQSWCLPPDEPHVSGRRKGSDYRPHRWTGRDTTMGTSAAGGQSTLL